MTIRKYIFMFLLMSLMGLSFGQAALYEPQGIGGGGAFTSFSMSPYDEDLWFVATDMGTLFRTTDGGQHWYPIDNAQIIYSSHLLYSVPLGFCADPNIVFFTNEGKNPLRSIDKGQYWYSIQIPLQTDERIKYWVPNSENENMILCATDEKLFRSMDKGVSWTPCGISGPSRGTFFDYEDNYIYHATTAGVYRSGDMGVSFTEYHVPNVLPLLSFSGGRDAQGLTMTYIDGDGENAVGPWIQQYIGLVDGADQEDYDYSILTSGFVWVRGPGEPDFHRVQHRQTYDRITYESEYLYGGAAVFIPGGPHPSAFAISNTQYNVGGVFMAENDSQTVYVTGHWYWPRMYGTKTFVTENAGQTWEKRFHCNDWDIGYVPWPADKLEYSAVGIEVGWYDSFWDNFAINQRNSAMAGGTGYYFLHVTRDTGQHWQAPFTEFADTGPRTSGKQWRSTGLEDTAIQIIEFHPTNPQLMYMGVSDLGGFVSENGGDSLRIAEEVYNTYYDFDFDPADDNVVYMAASGYHAYPTMWYYQVLDGNGGIFRSNNRGGNWTRLTPNNNTFNRSFLSVAYDDSRDIIYAGSHGDGVARSLDNGVTWDYFNNGIPAGQGRIIPKIILDDNGNAYALLAGDYTGGSHTNQTQTGIYYLDVVGDATEWVLLRNTVHIPPEADSNPLSSFLCYPVDFVVDPTNSDILWMIDYEMTGNWLCAGIWKSTDRGQNWHRVQQFTHPTDIILNPDNPNEVYVSGRYVVSGRWGEGGLMHTTNGGNTWQVNNRVPFKKVGYCAALDPNDDTQIWYGFYGAGMLHGPKPTHFTSTVNPTTPQNLDGTVLSTGHIELNWTGSTSDSGIKGYIIYSGPRCIGFTDATSFLHTGVTPDTDYSYRVVAEDNDGDLSGFSNHAYEHSLPAVVPSLETPTDLTAMMVSTSQVNLSWNDNSSTETGFRIERLTGRDGTVYEQIAEVSAGVTTYEDTGLVQGTKYFYKVRAYNASDNSYFSDVAYAVTDGSFVNQPTQLEATVVSQSQIDLSWEDNSGNEDGFQIERSAILNDNYAQLAVVGADVESYQDITALPGITYYYRVRGYNADTESDDSNEVSAVIPLIINTPTDLIAAPVSLTQIDLAWTDVSGNEEGFEIERSESDSAHFVQIATTVANANSYQDTGLVSGTTYYYRIRAYNGSYHSNYSALAFVMTFVAQSDDPIVDGVEIPLNPGDIKVVGSLEGKGAVNPDKGDTVKIFYLGNNPGQFKCLIFSLKGELVWEGIKNSVTGYFEWIPKNIASGVYIVHIKGPGINKRKKIIIIM